MTVEAFRGCRQLLRRQKGIGTFTVFERTILASSVQCPEDERQYHTVVVCTGTHHASHAPEVGGIEAVVGSVDLVEGGLRIESDSFLRVGDGHDDV